MEALIPSTRRVGSAERPLARPANSVNADTAEVMAIRELAENALHPTAEQARTRARYCVLAAKPVSVADFP
eukprot:3939071-Rhodomonas_salina.4